jgi:Ran GTPase-activating protein (RanGAP) involved in mRNA processing and transport
MSTEKKFFKLVNLLAGRVQIRSTQVQVPELSLGKGEVKVVSEGEIAAYKYNLNVLGGIIEVQPHVESEDQKEENDQEDESNDQEDESNDQEDESNDQEETEEDKDLQDAAYIAQLSLADKKRDIKALKEEYRVETDARKKAILKKKIMALIDSIKE